MRSVPACRPASADRCASTVRVSVDAVEEHDLAREFGLLEDSEQVFLRAARFGEDQRLLLQASPRPALSLRFGRGGKAPPQCGEQHFALRVLERSTWQARGTRGAGHFLPQLRRVAQRVSCVGCPACRVFIVFVSHSSASSSKFFPVCRQLRPAASATVAALAAAAPAVAPSPSSVLGDRVGRDASSLRRISVMSCRWLAGSA